MWHRAPRHWWSLRLPAVIGVVWLVGNIAYIFLGSNFHVVIEDRCYRAAQPAPGEMARWAKAHGIRTVINLRGTNLDHRWYHTEVQTMAELDIELLDVKFSGIVRNSESQLRELADLIDKAREPVLLHCQQGIDRTGFAAAAYLLLRSDTPLESARKQLHLRYGHLWFARCGKLNDLFEEYEAWLELYDATHTPDQFRRWVREGYKM